jgi:hypothetical protein
MKQFFKEMGILLLIALAMSVVYIAIVLFGQYVLIP